MPGPTALPDPRDMPAAIDAAPRARSATWVAALGALLAGCADATTDPAAEVTRATAPLAAAPRELGTWRGHALALTEEAPAPAETDAAPGHTLTAVDVATRARTTLARGLRTAVLRDDLLLVISSARQLQRLDVDDAGEVRATPLLDGAYGAPALTADGAVIVSRFGDEPGESDLWLIPEARDRAIAPSTDRGPTTAPRALFPAPGADDRPHVLPDGRLLFVSTRTTVASLWLTDPARTALTQLTNRGLTAGRPRLGFVPPPERDLEVDLDADLLTYDAGDGERWRVELGSGRAARSFEGGAR